MNSILRFAGKQCIRKTAPVLVIILIIGFMLAPRYLVYADPPIKSDIIVQFPVPEMETMRRESMLLIGEGFSEYLCTPTSLSLYRTNQDRTGLTAIRFPDVVPTADLHGQRFETEINMAYFEKLRRDCRFPRYYENTHAEMLLAKKVMGACGFRKAIFVSSPYHMRRIKIMAGRIFDSAFDIRIVPSRLEKRFETPLPSSKDMQHVFMELPKMVWFLCYDMWDRWTGGKLMASALPVACCGVGGQI
jgi:hypothetical protein